MCLQMVIWAKLVTMHTGSISWAERLKTESVGAKIANASISGWGPADRQYSDISECCGKFSLTRSSIVINKQIVAVEIDFGKSWYKNNRLLQQLYFFRKYYNQK